MEKIDIVFIVLHYLTETDTLDCIESIYKNIDTSSFRIVVVDNASPNDSYQKLKNKIECMNEVFLIKTEKNLGFANGNNFGIIYARKKWGIKYIAVINNDVQLMRGPFYEIIDEKYKKTEFAVLGPMVLTRDGYCNTSPISLDIPSQKQVEREIRHFRRRRFINKYNLSKLYLFFLSIRDLLKKKQQDIKPLFEDQKGVCLNGCFLIFSERFFDKFDGLDSRTFMYFEEPILLLHLKCNQLLSMYTPDIRIYHKECVSTNYDKQKIKDKVEFNCKNRYDSRKVYLEVLRKYGLYRDNKSKR